MASMTNIMHAPARVGTREGIRMKAVVYTRYGSPDVLEFKEVERPTPKDNEVLIRVYAASVNSVDLHLLRGEPFLTRLRSGLLKPRKQILGADIVGRVEAVGGSVTRFKAGDDVFGDLSRAGFGGFAEYVCAREDALAMKPAYIPFVYAAAAPMEAVTALRALRDRGHIMPGHKVLIDSASGGVGTFAVQIAKALGAEVTAVCAASKVELVRSLGADHVVDYTRDGFTDNAQRYDLILAAKRYHSLAGYERMLTPTGTYVVYGSSMARRFRATLLDPLDSKARGKKIGDVQAGPDTKDLTIVKELLETGKVVPVIDSSYPLSKLAEAMRYLETGEARGKVVISV